STMYWMIVLVSAVSVAAIVSSSTFLSQKLFADSRYASLFSIAAVGLALGLCVDIAMLYLMIKDRSLLLVTIGLSNLVSQVGFNIWFIVYMGLGLKGIFYSMLITRAILAVVVSLLKETRASLRRSQ
ncbi:MAG: hypothetical protein L0229_13935, partial [Blastocatellia bacterium]|nr:hypothetical protein [Blastocatellia bacterium]